MIITILKGGLGNQMFQYAMARRVSILNNTDLALDITSFSWNKLRVFELADFFNINVKIATVTDINNVKFSHKYFLSDRVKRKLMGEDFPYFLRPVVNEQSLMYDENILKVNKHSIMDGSWQSEKYFDDIKNVISKDFTFKHNANDYYSRIIKNIRNNNTVSIHVRRGDYVSNNITNSFHGTCSLDYYNSAIAHISKSISNITYVIISDDIEWCKNNLSHIPNSVFVENNKGMHYEDMRLMSLCTHNIIANSSFSWWGAWLNSNPNKIVIAPKQWFVSSEMQAQTNDLIPSSWIRL
jgi:hypothetical protein